MKVFNVLAGGKSASIVETTHAELVTLRDNAQLQPGQLYRITDYVATTTDPESRSANHPFDIIVIADDVDVLNENASAISHEGDTYFAKCHLETWKLKYSIDNDSTRFNWADEENGKGVIYQMIDENNNEMQYDFKGIQFKRYKITECENAPSLVGRWSAIGNDNITIDEDDYCWCYLFNYTDDNNITYDASVYRYDFNSDKHIIENCVNKTRGRLPNCVCYISNTSRFRSSNWFCGENCHSWTTENFSESWSCKDNCHSWICGNTCRYWICNYNCDSWTLGDTYSHFNIMYISVDESFEKILIAEAPYWQYVSVKTDGTLRVWNPADVE